MSVRFEERSGRAADLHADDWPDDWPQDGPVDGRDPASLAVTDAASLPIVVRRCEVVAPALVLGSTQDLGIVDLPCARKRGIDVVRRRSGGGAVLLVPGECAWVDVYLAASDMRWDDRVDRSFGWVGETWLGAAAALGAVGARVHEGRPEADDLGRLVCFGGLGSGEVVLGGRKLVGMSQRRTRRGARIQCLVPRVFDVGAHADLLRPVVDVDELSRRVATCDRPSEEIAAAFVAALDA